MGVQWRVSAALKPWDSGVFGTRERFWSVKVKARCSGQFGDTFLERSSGKGKQRSNNE